MDFTWVALALNDLLWLGVAFSFGLLAKRVGLPPLVGYLLAGFVLSAQSSLDGELLKKMADLGITLLLFTIGLKINLKTILRPQIWGVTAIHTALTIVIVTSLLYLLTLIGISQLEDLNLQTAALIAFALSFSSTVFVVKALEEKGELASLHGRIAVGILIIQDILAVVFLAASTGKLPSIWSLALFLLIPLQPLIFKVFDWVGRGELLILYGLLLAIGGSEVFELVEVKGDLGALIFGLIVSTHSKSEELAKTMLGFKDLFLLGFFLSIGINGTPDVETLLLSLIFIPLIAIKGAMYFLLFLKFNLRARISLLATVNLSNYSEFGLIVIAIGVANGWLHNQWLVVLALSISFSFVISSILNRRANKFYTKYRSKLKRLQSEHRLPYDQSLDLGNANIAIIGMGAVGTGAYNKLNSLDENKVVGIDINIKTVQNQNEDGREVIHGDPTDADFWDRLDLSDKLDIILLTLPKLESTLAVVNMLRLSGFKGRIATTAKFDDEVEMLKNAGANTVFDMHTEAGSGFASHVLSVHQEKKLKSDEQQQ